eukprot:TRINITY_DN1247_c0_g3_i3.p1 TRINITY_DN1247_c0_g3~~TRINITY_DN1247_c0_g3_i3.p1  ORF type:complete len:329 (+),score=47.73 TRINITY_DN1247_c0_g3_i3:19-1005(+)
MTFDRKSALADYKKLHEQQIEPSLPLRILEVGIPPDDRSYEHEERHGTKRKRDDQVSKQRHSTREKKRRMELNDAIERLQTLVPKMETRNGLSAKATKVTILMDTADYISKLKESFAAVLQEKEKVEQENQQLLMQINQLTKSLTQYPGRVPDTFNNRQITEGDLSLPISTVLDRPNVVPDDTGSITQTFGSPQAVPTSLFPVSIFPSKSGGFPVTSTSSSITPVLPIQVAPPHSGNSLTDRLATTFSVLDTPVHLPIPIEVPKGLDTGVPPVLPVQTLPSASLISGGSLLTNVNGTLTPDFSKVINPYFNTGTHHGFDISDRSGVQS